MNKKMNNVKIDGRTRKKTEEEKEYRKNKSLEYWASEQAKQQASERGKKQWSNHSANITLININTNEEVFVKTSLRQFALDRNLSYKSLNQLINGKIKTNGGWYVKDFGKPIFTSQKGQKRKPLSEEQKIKISKSNSNMKTHDYNKTLINLKDPNKKIIVGDNLPANPDIKKYNLEPKKVRRVIYGEIKVLNDEWILEENYEEYIATNEICKICFKGYKNTDSLRNHLKRQHNISQKDFYKYYESNKADLSKHKKPIDQIDIETGKIIKTWESSIDAGNELEIYEDCIRKAAKGFLITYKGYKWRFHNETDREEYSDKLKEAKRKELKKEKRTNKIFYWDIKNQQKVFVEKEEVNRSIATTAYYHKKALETNDTKFFKYYKGKLYFFEKHFNEEVFIKLFNSMSIECKECNARFHKNQPLTSHIKSIHNMSSEDYTIKHFYNGHKPSCKACNNLTRYTSFSFKEYCTKHSAAAMSTGGTKGGRAEAWSKGLTKETDSRLDKYSKKYMGENNPFYGKTHTKELKEKMSQLKRLTKEEIIERLKTRDKDFDFKFDYEQYKSRQDKIVCICKKCNRQMEKTLSSLESGTLCKYCYPFVMSKTEIEIGDFVEHELGIENIVRNDRKTIAPKELDIYLPDHNVAIEYNGLYWHSELNKEDRYFHYKKNQDCLEKNINLISIDEDHWRDQQDLIKSIIKHVTKKSNNKIAARKCRIEKTKNEQRVKDFFNTNHISGHANAMQVFLLIDKKTNEIVSGLTLRKAFHRKYKDYMEIGRFANKCHTSVQGAFTKLLKQAIKHVKKNHPDKKGIVSYCDLAFGNGNVYEKNGFNKVIRSKSKEINFFYTDGKKRYNRFDFRAQPGKPEKQVAEEAGVFKIYGCGNSLYELKL